MSIYEMFTWELWGREGYIHVTSHVEYDVAVSLHIYEICNNFFQQEMLLSASRPQ